MSAINLQDISSTIVPKSDQLNADQLIGSTLTITIQSVTAGNAEQPIILHYAGEDGRPYKPGKTMRKVLILAWGQDATQWVGKSMTLFNDASVVFAKQEVGGIRISHLSDIKQEIKVSLNSTRGKKDLHRIAPMPRPTNMVDKLSARVSKGEAAAVALELSELDPDKLAIIWDKLDDATAAKLTEAWPK